MRRNLTKLGGLTHLLRPDAKKVGTAAAFNAHLDRVCDVLQGMKIEADSNEPAPAEPEKEPEQLETPKAKRKAKNQPNRMHEGGEDRKE